MAARELGELALPDVLAFCLLVAEFDPERWPRAAARWLERFVVESPAITINEAALAAAAVLCLERLYLRNSNFCFCHGRIIPDLQLAYA
jgi:hypothetical protein